MKNYKYKWWDIDLKSEISFDWEQWKNKKEFLNWLFKHLDEYYRILKDNKHLILFCDKRNINHIQDYGESIGFKVRQILIWQKSNPVPRARKISPMTTFETAVWLTKGKAKVEHYNWELGMVHDIIKCPIPRKEWLDERHPTQKPLFLMEVLVGLFSKPWETVLDSFAGSGSTIVSALAMGREIIANDYDPTINEHDKWKKIFENNYKNRLNYAYKILKDKVAPFFLERKSSKTKIERVLELLGLEKGAIKDIQDV